MPSFQQAPQQNARMQQEVQAGQVAHHIPVEARCKQGHASACLLLLRIMYGRPPSFYAPANAMKKAGQALNPSLSSS
eukprot:1159435-Pelagomonas_calceolata.AAC.7